jgi:hypothetical protein
MNRDGNIFIDLDSSQLNQFGNYVCGDVCLSKKIKAENRTITILADGLGSGIKANILATITSSILLNFMAMNEPIDRVISMLLSTLPIDSKRKIAYSTFTVIEVDFDGETTVIEYGNPETLFFRGIEPIKAKQEKVMTPDETGMLQALYLWKFAAKQNDRIISFSDGVSQSGMGQKNMSFGWEMSDIRTAIKMALRENPKMTSKQLSALIVEHSKKNDNFKPKDDISCSVIFFTKPRKLLLSSGPPFHRKSDSFLANKINLFNGFTIVCGGTTAQIVSRELKRPIESVSINSNLLMPPEVKIEGIDLVTEGILTLGEVSKLLEEPLSFEESKDTPAGHIVHQLLNHDEIHFLVGTKVNEAHQDPTLPIELEIRRNVIKKIARLLEDNYLKNITLEYL